MAKNTRIEWADHTFNPWEGCTKVGPGCDNCYAEARNARFAGGSAINWGPGAPRRRTSAANWRKPLAWDKAHAEFFAQHGRRQRVFCASLADVFDNEVDPLWRADLFDLILRTPKLDWLLVTKRIGNVRSMLPMLVNSFADVFPNVWIGATVANQTEADRDIPKLLATPAAKRFLSIEPMLGPVDLRNLNEGNEVNEIDCLKPADWAETVQAWRETSETWEEDFEDWFDLPVADAIGPMHAGIDWVICGGESGPNARPMHPEWAQSLRDQCAAAGVPFLFKQWGEWKPISQMREAEHQSIYKSKVKAGPHEDQLEFDEVFGRVCTVPYTVVHLDGSTHDITEPKAWITGAMQTFKVNKKAAGRLLDGVEHNGFPGDGK